MNIKSKTVLNEITTGIIIIAVAALMALNYQLFIVENNFAPAGLNGIATMIQYKTGFSIGYVSLIINIPLCVFAYFLVNKRFAVLTLIFCLSYSMFFLFFQTLGLEQFQYNVNGHNTIFPALLSGLINGFIYGICFQKSASTGGIDIISKYVSYTRPNINFFWLTFILNAMVALASFFVYATPGADGQLVYDYNPVCLCILYCFLSSYMGNYIIRGTKTAIQFTIITDYPKEIACDISKELRHGSTQIEAMGSFSSDRKTMLVCVINKHQIMDLQKILKRYSNTFSFSAHVNETYGNFKLIKPVQKTVKK